MDDIKENEYSEVDFTLTVKNKSGKDIPESEFNKIASSIEEKMSNEKFLVMVQGLDGEQDEIEIKK